MCRLSNRKAKKKGGDPKASPPRPVPIALSLVRQLPGNPKTPLMMKTSSCSSQQLLTKRTQKKSPVVPLSKVSNEWMVGRMKKKTLGPIFKATALISQKTPFAVSESSSPFSKA